MIKQFVHNVGGRGKQRTLDTTKPKPKPAPSTDKPAKSKKK